jgi:hypothetical protein
MDGRGASRDGYGAMNVLWPITPINPAFFERPGRSRLLNNCGETLGGNRQHPGSESFPGEALSSGVAAAFYRDTAECPQCSSKTGRRTSLGRDLECARGAEGGTGSHGQLGWKSLGSTAGRSSCGASWSCGRDRTAVGRKPLVALPGPLSVPAGLPGTAAAVHKTNFSRPCKIALEPSHSPSRPRAAATALRFARLVFLRRNVQLSLSVILSHSL